MSIDLLQQIGALQRSGAPQGTPVSRPGSSTDFGNTLESLLDQHKVANRPSQAPTPETPTLENTAPVAFSRHAQARLESRGLDLDADQMERLGEGIDQLDQRGAKESLVLMDDMALIVGVPKRTVITAMSRSEAMGNIFTNIDSTLVVD
jgi:flagellar operon protein